MNIVICDDDSAFREEFEQYLKHLMISSDIYDGSFKIFTVGNAEKLEECGKIFDIDILFLDISMPQTDGFEIAEKISAAERKPCLIFISDYEEKVYYSIHFEPFRFVRKEHYREEAKEALFSAIKKITASNQTFIIKNRADVIYLRIPNIYYITKEKLSNYVVIHTATEEYRYRASVNECRNMLSGFSFLPLDQASLVNAAHIVRIDGERVLLDNSTMLFMPEYRTKEFRAAYLKYMRVQ